MTFRRAFCATSKVSSRIIKPLKAIRSNSPAGRTVAKHSKACAPRWSVGKQKPMPEIYLIGGPNGAGKTTTATKVLPELLNCQGFVNAVYIARGLSPFNESAVVMQAGRLMLRRL